MNYSAPASRPPHVSALAIAAELKLPPPTTEQQAVIEAPLLPTLVVAGAGSGKTETMANRVLWLLANGHARPDQILGLTFTRKAAGELGERINGRIADLDAAGLLPTDASTADATAAASSSDLFNAPTVATYNSFASRLFTDNALLLGREPESVLLGETSAWLLARRVVIDHGDARLVAVNKSLDQVTDAVLQLSRALAENPTDWHDGAPGEPHDLVGLAERFSYLTDLSYGKARKRTPFASVVSSVAAVAPLPVLAELAARYSTEKRRLGLIEFSDQVALALQVCQKVDAVVQGYRDQYRIVLLDEYQDTSVLQTELLHTLFQNHPVMAVGDPHQSIYGWRGASSANLLGFAHDFSPEAATATMSLSVTWRNSATVLDAANALVAPLSDALRAAPGGIQVQTLTVPPGTSAGHVDALMAETLSDEAAAIAAWFATRLVNGQTGAMLFRARREMDYFAEVLREHGVRAHVLGLGGLLTTPEVADVVSVLRVVHDPAAGSELVRLLSGARYRVGPRDLQALSAVARWLATHNYAQKALSTELKAKLRASVAGDEQSSLVDALDFIGTASETHHQLEGFSELGRARLQSAGRQLAWLRSRAGLPLLDFVRLIEQDFRLDIELIANESNDLGLANLHSFHDTVTSFLDSDEQGTLASFLRWLRRAEMQDDLGPRAELSEEGTVQLLTIHGAKGLEWDFVAIPNLEEKSLPAAARDTSGWLRFGELPYNFRGDHAQLPQLIIDGHETQCDYDLAFQNYKNELAARHDDEERRLIYVATTRAKAQLLLTGSFWGPGKTARRPSCYLTELVAAGLIDHIPLVSAVDEKPDSGNEGTETWPFDPLGSRRPVVEDAASRVRESDADTPTRWSHAVTLLLAERALRLRGEKTLVPTRIPASRFKDYVDDMDGVAAELRRPMPQRPYRATRLGTLFHSWVERRAGGATGTDKIDASVNELDFGDEEEGAASLGELAAPEQERFAQLQATFERSEWADRKPVDVEIEIHHVLDGQVFVCKLDAVYRTETGYQVVDWKTGRAPKNAADLELKQTQLALYRLAYARFKGIDPSTVDAVFYFVADDTVVAPERLYSEADLLAAWSGALAPARQKSASISVSESVSASVTPEPGAFESVPSARDEPESENSSFSSDAVSKSPVSPEKL